METSKREEVAVYVTSDHHFNHKNILQLVGRSFASIEDMDAELIARWNSVVRERDIVYHLGDFCFGTPARARQYLEKLNGQIRILHNQFHHDASWWDAELIEKYALPEITVVKVPGYERNGYGKVLVMSHWPIYVWDRKHYGSWHVYGHIHHRGFEIPDSPLSMNVCVDCTDYYPVSLNKIAEIMVQREQELGLYTDAEEQGSGRGS